MINSPGIRRSNRPVRHARLKLPLLVAALVAALVVGSCSLGPPSATGTVPVTAPPIATAPAKASSPVSAAPTAAASPIGAPTTALPTATLPAVLHGPPASTPAPAATIAACSVRTFDSMSEAERIGQLFFVSEDGDALAPEDASAIRTDHFGSVWLSGNRSVGVAAIRRLSDSIQALATSGATARVRFFVAADQEGGLVQRLAGPGFSTIPSALQQGLLTPVALEAHAQTWGRELAAAGVNVDLAPVMDVVPPGTDASNEPIGALQREYGHDLAVVAPHGVAVIRGMAAAGVATSLKHFPGLGRVTGNTDSTAGVVDAVTTADDPYLASFQAGMAAGAPFVMVSLATYAAIDPAHPATFSPTIVTTLLRDRLGFGGLILSDSLTATAAQAVPVSSRGVEFLAAGGDMMIVSGMATAAAIAQGIAARAATDASFARLVDAAVLRVLRLKGAYGLLPCAG